MSRIQKGKTGVQHLTVVADHATRRIDNYLMGKFNGLPRTRVYQMLRRGEVRVNGGRIKQDYRLQEGDIVRVPPIQSDKSKQGDEPHAYLLERIKDSLIFEDDDIIILNKPAGIVVHSGSGRSFGVIEILRILRPDESDLQLVHRLDRETSGCLLVAKNMNCLKRLHAVLKRKGMVKQYQALLKGRLAKQTMKVEQALKKNINRSGERLVGLDQSGKYALSRFEIEKKLKRCTLVKVQIETGRTHQIRVHAAHIGHPVAGDDKYGDREFNKMLKTQGLNRLFLHASMVRLPEQLGAVTFRAPLPDDLKEFLNKYG